MTETNGAILTIEFVLEIYLFILEEHTGSNIILSTCTGLPCRNDYFFCSVHSLGMPLSKLITS